MIEYTPDTDCCGVRPTYALLDEAMREHFAACPGGTPEAPLIDWAWREFGRPGHLFIDIGAHVGSWALPFALAGMEVTAFEPNPTIAALLEQSRETNGLRDRLLPLPFALGHQVHVAHLTAPGLDGGMASIVREFNGPVDEQVAVRTLDQTDLAPRLIKIDVEGAELDVLRGAERTIREHQPTILFECWADERGQRIPELFSYVKELGYTVEKTWWPEMWLCVPEDRYRDEVAA